MITNINQVKKLRQLTQAGIMDCRKALKFCDGNLIEAKKRLKKKGNLLAAKKAKRETKSGLIETYVHNNSQVGAIIKLSCETDFVARNKDFRQLAHELAMQVAAMKPESIKELLNQDYIRDPKKKVKDLIKEAIGKIKENIKIGKIVRMEI